MAKEITLEEKKIPFRDADVDQLFDLVWRTSEGTGLTARILRFETTPIPLKKIKWSNIRYLAVLGKEGAKSNLVVKEEGLKPGAYINPDGNWLLLTHQEDSSIQRYIDCCEDLKILEIYNTALSSLDLASAFKLERFIAMGNIDLSVIRGLGKLRQLTYFNLSDCKKIPDLSYLSELTQLTTLKIQSCTDITSLPDLGKLTQLTTLNLWGCSQIAALPLLSNLLDLSELNLHGCVALIKLPALKQLKKLKRLYLDGCTGITLLPDDIKYLNSLRLLDLSNLKLKKLPDWLPEIAESFSTKRYNGEGGTHKAFVYLRGTTVTNIPDMSIFDQPYEMIVNWFKGGTEFLDEIKVIFLGNGDVGKTHTIARLCQDGGEPPKSYTGSSTPGIIIEDYYYMIDGRIIQVHFWDFGGQDILYSMHRMFMTKRTVYVVMVDARNESKSQQAREWLDTVKSFAPDAPVMLVINKSDQNPGVTIDGTSLKREYANNLKTIVIMSALNDSKELFKSKFTAALLDTVRKSGVLKEKWPKEWKAVKRDLQDMTGSCPYISNRDFEEICDRHNVTDNREDLLSWFNDLGISFCQYQDFRLKDYVILRPDWITNAVYTILFNKKEDVNNGMISLEEINSLLNPAPDRKHKIMRVREETYAWKDISYVLDVARKFSLSYAADQNTEFFPMLCKEDSKPIAQTYADAQDTLEFHMEFEYLPNNVLHNLMVKRWAELDLNNVWLTGARFVEKHTGLSAVVRIEDDTLKIFVRANRDALHAPNTYLSVISGTLEQIRMDLKLPAPKKWLVYKLEETKDVFDYEELADMLEDGETEKYSRKWRRKLRIRDIMNQAEPAVVKNEMKLLTTIVEACQDLQGSMMYWGREENDRNTVVRNKLRPAGYIVHDQALDGRSSGGKRAGELDMDIRIRETTPWTICEALILKDGGKSKWNEHLEKLLDNYNTHGLDFLILLCYVDCDKQRFAAIWEGKDGYTTHIPKKGTERFHTDPDSFEMVPGEQWAGNNLIKVAKCQYSCGGSMHTVYHIFVHMDKKPQ